MKIETIEVAGLAGVLTALRLPFGKEVRSSIDCQLDWHDGGDKPTSVLYTETLIGINEKDEELMMTLIRRGDEHAKVVRGIMVWAKITAPVYWWCEEETYRAGHERLASESTMHMDCRGLSGSDLQDAKSAIPMGKELTKVDMFSYQALRKMVMQRHDHRLPEWHQFVDWVKTLPFAREFILNGLTIDGEYIKPIKERAKLNGGLFRVFNQQKDNDLQAFERGYKMGAKEQKRIDVDKAISWLDAHTDWDAKFSKDECYSLFRKAMED